MKAHFKHHRIIDGKSYKPGDHELDEKLADHWYVKALVKAGDLFMAEPEEKEEEASDIGDDAAEEESSEGESDDSSQPQSKAERKAARKAGR